MLRRTTTAVVLTIALVAGAITGCGGQGASTTEAAQTTTETTEETGHTTEKLQAELKDAIANAPSFTSVTIREHDLASYASGEGGAPEVFELTSVYKFEEDDGTLKTSMHADDPGLSTAYYTDGDNAVYVTDGPVYSGTTEQFELPQAKGAKAYLTETIGDLRAIVDSARSAGKEQAGTKVTYTLELDVERYVAGDAVLSLMAEYGTTVEGATVTIGIDADGHIVDVGRTLECVEYTATKDLTLSDFDTTVVNEMPEATATYEQMEDDMREKLDELSAGAHTSEGNTPT